MIKLTVGAYLFDLFLTFGQRSLCICHVIAEQLSCICKCNC